MTGVARGDEGRRGPRRPGGAAVGAAAAGRRAILAWWLASRAVVLAAVAAAGERDPPPRLACELPRPPLHAPYLVGQPLVPDRRERRLPADPRPLQRPRLLPAPAARRARARRGRRAADGRGGGARERRLPPRPARPLQARPPLP